MPLNDKLEIEKNVKKSGSSFFWGMKLLPEEKRRAMFSIYAFCREVDDIADDLKSSKTSKEKKLTHTHSTYTHKHTHIHIHTYAHRHTHTNKLPKISLHIINDILRCPTQM